jgi:hypothetical protein
MTVRAIKARSGVSLLEREVIQLTASRSHGCDFRPAGRVAVALTKAGKALHTIAVLRAGTTTGAIVALDARRYLER